MATSLTTREVYPITDDREFVEMANTVLLDAERDPVGRTILKRQLTEAERAIAVRRRYALESPLVPATRREIREVIEPMMAGLGMAAMTDDESKVIVAQYVATLSRLPLFAIAQACGRFSRGEVKAEELGLKKFPLGYRPGTDQLYVVADRIAQRYRAELSAARALLNAKVMLAPRKVTPEDRERALAVMKDLAQRLGAKGALEDAERAQRAQRARERQALIARESVAREYRALGLDVPADPPGGVLTSPSMLFKAGWRIEKVEGENVLVRPGHRAQSSEAMGEEE